MAGLITGPELDAVVEEARKQYNADRQYLISQLAKPYPYGTVPTTPEEQYQSFMLNSPNPQYWLQMRQALYRIYKGTEDPINKVETEIARYVKRMETVGMKLRANQPIDELTGML